LVEESTDIKELQSKWDKHLLKVRGEEWEQRNFYAQFIFQPLLSIHLYSDLLQESEPEEQGDGEAVYFLSIIAFFILLIAWVNYINLSTAKSFERANEVGVRKVLGAQKSQLRKQFLFESFVVNLVALIIALVLVRVLWPWFGMVSGREIPVEYVFQLDFWLTVILFLVAGSVVSGFYPALVLSSFKPISVLKGKAMRTPFGDMMRKGLVIFQFVASVILISGVIIVFQQISFMKNMDLGVNLNKTLVLEGPGITDSLYQDKLENFKTEALRISGISSMTAGTNVPGDEIFWTRGIRRLSGGPENQVTVYNMGIDYDYLEAFDLKLISGRNFDKDFPNDNERVLINRSLAETLEFDDFESAIGHRVRLGGDTLEIAGILENYHQMSLKNEVTPIVFRLFFSSSYYAFKVEGENYQQVIEQLKEPWETFFAGNPIDYILSGSVL